MQAVVFLVLVISSAILAQTKLGEPCGENVGEITLIDDCMTAIVVPEEIGVNDDWHNNSSMVCCIKSSYFKRDKRSTRKSEEACAKFGPGIPKKVTNPNHVQPRDYQHNVALRYNSSPDDKDPKNLCTGTLISENYVLTVAHCVTHYGKSPTMIRAGTIDVFDEEDGVKPQDIPISETIIHPDYHESRYKNDIALLKLAKPVNFTSYVQPACLYTKKDVPEKMIATGWGVILKSDYYFSDLLLKSSVVLMDSKKCYNTYKDTAIIVFDSDFCGLTTNTDICHTGSAFVIDEEDNRVRIVGVASRGFECSYILPTVYSRVSSHLDWIESIVWP